MNQFEIGPLTQAVRELMLYEHQEQVALKVIEKMRTGEKRIMVYGTCGSGKTETATYLMKRFAAERRKVFFLVDKIVLVEQTSKRLTAYGVDHGVIQGENTHGKNKLIQICSSQSLESREIDIHNGIVFVDEAHNSRKWLLEQMANNPHITFIGLSASPFTECLGRHWTSLVSGMSMAWMTENGYLAPVKTYVGVAANMSGAKLVAGEYSDDDITDRGIEIIGKVVDQWKEKTTKHFGGPVKTICFVASTRHGIETAQLFSDAGYYFVNISYLLPEESKRAILEEFAKPDSKIIGICSCEILTKGFDVADVRCGISLRPYRRSFSSHVQQRGRVARSYPGKQFALWLDHSGNCLRFRERWDALYENGVQSVDELHDGEKKFVKSEAIVAQEAKDVVCPECDCVISAADHGKCPECGHVLKKQAGNVEINEVDGDLILLDDIKTPELTEDEIKILWLKQFKGHCLAKGKKIGMAAYNFRDKFGHMPAFGLIDAIGAMQPGPEVLNFIKSRQIAFAKSRKKEELAKQQDLATAAKLLGVDQNQLGQFVKQTQDNQAHAHR